MGSRHHDIFMIFYPMDSPKTDTWGFTRVAMSRIFKTPRAIDVVDPLLFDARPTCKGTDVRWHVHAYVLYIVYNNICVKHTCMYIYIYTHMFTIVHSMSVYFIWIFVFIHILMFLHIYIYIHKCFYIS